jgi:hypothetical protein
MLESETTGAPTRIGGFASVAGPDGRSAARSAATRTRRTAATRASASAVPSTRRRARPVRSPSRCGRAARTETLRAAVAADDGRAHRSVSLRLLSSRPDRSGRYARLLRARPSLARRQARRRLRYPGLSEAIGTDLSQTCCAGKCRSLSHDPANCGACGRACPPGQRRPRGLQGIAGRSDVTANAVCML